MTCPLSVVTGEELDKEVLRYQSMWLSEASLKTRSSQWNFYYKFCAETGVDPPLPTSFRDVLRYIVYMASRLKYVSLTNYLVALWQLHKVNDFPHVDPLNFKVQCTIKGVKRELGTESVRARPIGRALIDYQRLSRPIAEPSSFQQLVWSFGGK